MLLQKLRCAHFKNYTAVEIPFAEQLNLIIGSNGAGKTTLLDAIHYLSLTKSAFNTTDSHSIQHGQTAFAVEGSFVQQDKSCTVQCSFQKSKGKLIKKDGKPYDKLRDHVGCFPVVLATPYDMDLIRGGSEVRRKFFDGILCQLDGAYLNSLLKYHTLLKQRNSLLRTYKDAGQLNKDLLAIYDQQLLPLCQEIFTARNRLIQDFAPIFQTHYQYFVDATEEVQLYYESAVAESNFEQKFCSSLPQDLILQRTTQGVHRDEVHFVLNDHSLKKIGSQGQQKSFTLALRFAQFDYMHRALQRKPLLLLDDIFDKLDAQRINKLVQLMAQQHFGQVFMTDAKGTSNAVLMQQGGVDQALIEIEKGKDVAFRKMC
ncbi:MAG: DNA replication and repair protein RecF [Bacteroidota bacterium]